MTIIEKAQIMNFDRLDGPNLIQRHYNPPLTWGVYPPTFIEKEWYNRFRIHRTDGFASIWKGSTGYDYYWFDYGAILTSLETYFPYIDLHDMTEEEVLMVQMGLPI